MRKNELIKYRVSRSVSPTRREKSRVSSGPVPPYDYIMGQDYINFSVKKRKKMEMIKWKRGHFTYKTIAQANIEPAKESIDNSIKFLSNIKKVIGNEVIQDVEKER